jgi:hypothetical protein
MKIRRPVIYAVSLAAVLALSACGKDHDASSSAPPPASAMTAPPPPSASLAPPADNASSMTPPAESTTSGN